MLAVSRGRGYFSGRAMPAWIRPIRSRFSASVRSMAGSGRGMGWVAFRQGWQALAESGQQLPNHLQVWSRADDFTQDLGIDQVHGQPARR